MAFIKWRTLDGTGDTRTDFEPSPELVASVEEIFDGKSDLGRFASADEAHGYALAELAFKDAEKSKAFLAVIPVGGKGEDAQKVTTWNEVVNTPNLGEVIAVPNLQGG